MIQARCLKLCVSLEPLRFGKSFSAIETIWKCYKGASSQATMNAGTDREGQAMNYDS